MPPLPQSIDNGILPLNAAGSFVYQAFGRGDDLLYVGVTDDLALRLISHRQNRSPWVHEAVRLEWNLYPTRAIAERVERLTIERLMPKYNLRGNEQRIIADGMGHSRRYPAEAWALLGDVIRSSRKYGRRTLAGIAAVAGTDVATVQEIEAGADRIYGRSVLEGMERALDWQPGSLEAVLAGGQPMTMTADQRSERAIAAARRMMAGDRL